MKPAITLILTCLATWGAGSQAVAAPVISPFAADLSAGSYTADRAGGGSAQSVFNGGYWNAGTWGVHWVQADMGSTQTLSEVRLTVDVLPWTTTWQNVYLSDTPIEYGWGSLTPVASRTGYTSQYQQFSLSFAATSGRYLQVVSYGGASWTALGDGAGRSNWTDPGSSGPGGGQVPEPSSLALALVALGSVTALRCARASRV